MSKLFKYKMPKGTEMTPKLIESLIESHKDEKMRVMQLFEYYENHNSILNRKMKDSDKPNNKLPHPYAAYITNLATGYFVGEPVTYTVEADEQAQKFYDELQSINKYNDEPKHNATLAKYASIAGYSFELLYTDTNKKTRYKAIKTYEVIYIVDNTLEEAPLYAIRYYDLKNFETGKSDTYVEVYGQKEVTYYVKRDGKENLIKAKDSVEHHFNDVPVSIYENNEEGIGDFEKVIHLINSYDQAQSDTANDFEYFTDAYLAFYGTEGPVDSNDNEDVDMKENRMLIFQENGSKAEWLIKNINDTATENYKNRLDRDIHKFSMVPPMTDENFAGNVSGEAMKYKLLGLETLTGFKEQSFRMGLARRNELIANTLSFKNQVINKNLPTYDYTVIEPVFTRNIPKNNKELVEMFNNLSQDVSHETRLNLLSDIVPDPKAEIEKLKKEEEKEIQKGVPYQDQEGDVDGQE